MQHFTTLNFFKETVQRMDSCDRWKLFTAQCLCTAFCIEHFVPHFVPLFVPHFVPHFVQHFVPHFAQQRIQSLEKTLHKNLQQTLYRCACITSILFASPAANNCMSIKGFKFISAIDPHFKLAWHLFILSNIFIKKYSFFLFSL